MSRGERACRAVTDVAAQCLAATSAARCMRGVTDLLVELVGADGALYTEIDPVGRAVTHAISPENTWATIPVHDMATPVVRAMHPLVDHLCAFEPESPLALSDVLSDLAWRRLEMAQLMRPTYGRARQLYLPVMDGRVRKGWTFCRDGSDWSPPDREVAAALRPVLRAVVAEYGLSVGLPGPSLGALTPRETTVLRCLAHGLTASAIGSRLATSPRTVHKHVEHIYRKLGVSDRVSAVRAGAEIGLLTIAPPGPRRSDGQRF